MACSVVAGAAKDGICGPTTGNACSDGDACTEGDTCQAGTCGGGTPITCEADACETYVTCDPEQGCVFDPKPAGTVCRAGICEEGEATSEGTCDGASGACPDPEVTECGLYVCGTDACLSSCATEDDCAQGAVCWSGGCVIEDADGGQGPHPVIGVGLAHRPSPSRERGLAICKEKTPLPRRERGTE